MNTKRRPGARKSKSVKAKNPKFLGLDCLQFPADGIKQKKRNGNCHNGDETAAPADKISDQHSLLPLQTENELEEGEINDHENVAFFFSAADGVATTLTSLLDTSTSAEASDSSHTNNNSLRLDYLPPRSSAFLTQAYGEERAALVRNALRSRDRDSSEEKWVCYSEVVKEDEVTSSAVDPPRLAGIHRMSLKLDYEEIMNAWSNKGPLYIDAADNSQLVPEINHNYHLFSQEPYNYLSIFVNSIDLNNDPIDEICELENRGRTLSNELEAIMKD
ncbi:hypothetical protein OROGR_023483 [Orobanche gracilis]